MRQLNKNAFLEIFSKQLFFNEWFKYLKLEKEKKAKFDQLLSVIPSSDEVEDCSDVGRPRRAAVHERSLPIRRWHGVPLIDDTVDVVGNVDGIRLALRPPDERMLEQSVVLRPLEFVLDEAGVDKVDEFDAEALAVLARIQAGRITVNHLETKKNHFNSTNVIEFN
jgi:hypothetical protein